MLHAILNKPTKPMGEDEKERYRKCLTLILNCTDDKFEDTSEDPPYNALVSTDEFGNIPLHYATRFWNKDEEDQKIIKKVLEKGGLATIGIESGSSDLGIHGLKPEVNFCTHILKYLTTPLVRKKILLLQGPCRCRFSFTL